MPKQKVAAGLIIYRKLSQQIEYLLLQTSYGIHHWTPPKGHVDPGESDLETALRETEEESGLKRDDFQIHHDCKITLNYEVNNAPKIVYYWPAKLTNLDAVVKLSDEHQDFKWLGLKEACDLAKFNDMQKALKQCDEYIKNL